MSAVQGSTGILAEDAREQRERIVKMLTNAYCGWRSRP
jgi:hypothetical protein